MKVLFFHYLRTFTGCGEATISAGAGLDTHAVWAVLEQRFPGISQYRVATRLAQNGMFADPSTLFVDGDEVALIPPVSGG